MSPTSKMLVDHDAGSTIGGASSGEEDELKERRKKIERRERRLEQEAVDAEPLGLFAHQVAERLLVVGVDGATLHSQLVSVRCKQPVSLHSQCQGLRGGRNSGQQGVQTTQGRGEQMGGRFMLELERKKQRVRQRYQIPMMKQDRELWLWL